MWTYPVQPARLHEDDKDVCRGVKMALVRFFSGKEYDGARFRLVDRMPVAYGVYASEHKTETGLSMSVHRLHTTGYIEALDE